MRKTRFCLVLMICLTIFAIACGDDDDGTSFVRVSGNAFAFAPPGIPGGGRIVGATISVLEMPELTTISGENGFFQFDALPTRTDITFVLEADGFPTTHTKTFRLSDQDVEDVTFQVPNLTLLTGLGALAGVELDPEKCQIASTVTVVGKSLYTPGPHGEAGAVVTIEPGLAADQGPIYFNEDVIPDPSLSESSGDGGVAFVNVDPGDYTLTAVKDGLEIESVRLKCRAGVLANASPPYGLQVLE